MHHQRDTAQPGRQPARARRVTAETDGAAGAVFAQYAEGLVNGAQQLERHAQPAGRTLSAQAADIDHVELDARRRNLVTLHAAARTEPAHGNTRAAQAVRNGEAREDMTAGAARHDQYTLPRAAHAVAPFRGLRLFS